jgi:hypothetical protein
MLALELILLATACRSKTDAFTMIVQTPEEKRTRLAALTAAHEIRCNIGQGTYLDWPRADGPIFRPSADTTTSFAIFNASDISLSAGTARFVYDTGIFDAQVFVAEYGIHFVTKPPYQLVQPEFLSVYTYPGPGVDSSRFAAVWSGHNDIGGMPAPQLYYGVVTRSTDAILFAA